MAGANELRVTKIWGFEGKARIELPLFSTGVSAGFPSPADDSIERTLDLNEFLIQHPSATYFVRVEGNSMLDAGIHSGDILVVDWSIEPKSGDVVVAVVNDEFTVKRFRRAKGKCYLLAENPDFKPIEIKDGMHVEVRGVVTYAIHKV
jgi:DNA polymerase V